MPGGPGCDAIWKTKARFAMEVKRVVFDDVAGGTAKEDLQEVTIS